MNRILLIMMVKNESKIIERCINSTLGIIDGICVCDTGSTDNTVSLLDDIIARSGKPGKVYHCEFKNFGYNRTKSYEFALDFIKQLDWDTQTTFGLLLDADMVLKIEPSFTKNIISEFDHYKILQLQDRFTYYNIRLIRMSIKWKCIGVTHEVWCIDECIMYRGAVLHKDSIWIDDISDGGCKSDKFERDIRYLLKGIDEEPENKSRYYFYLGQSYFGIQNYEKSIEYYKKRLDEDGGQEETWFTYFMIAQCYFHMFLHSHDDYVKDIEEYCFKAYNFYNIRSEPLLLLSNLYNEINEFDKALEYINLGSGIPKPERQNFYMNDTVYECGFLEQKIEFLKAMKNTEICDLTIDLINRNKDKNLSLLLDLKSYCKKLKSFKNYNFKLEINNLDSASLNYTKDEYVYLLNDTYMILDNNLIPKSEVKNISHTNKCISLFSDFYTSCKEGNTYEYGKFEDGCFTPIGTYDIHTTPFITSYGLDFIETLHPLKFKSKDVKIEMSNIFSYFNSTLPGVVYNDAIWLLAFCYINSSCTLNIIIKLTKEGIPQSYTAPFFLEEEGIQIVLSFTLDQASKGVILYHSNNFLKIGKFDISKLELKNI